MELQVQSVRQPNTHRLGGAAVPLLREVKNKRYTNSLNQKTRPSSHVAAVRLCGVWLVGCGRSSFASEEPSEAVPIDGVGPEPDGPPAGGTTFKSGGSSRRSEREGVREDLLSLPLCPGQRVMRSLSQRSMCGSMFVWKGFLLKPPGLK